MFPFSQWGPFDRGEGKALLAAGAACLVFICFFVVIRPRHYRPSAPVPPRELLVPPAPAPAGNPLAEYRVKTEDFYETDFWNYSYGPYTLSDGNKIDLTLENSKLDGPNSPDSFALKDVFYKDVTGDGRAEAIVWLSHVNCTGSCTTSNLFYVYTVKNLKLKQIWQYETGSYAHGCGLRSLTLSGKQIIVESLGRCVQNEPQDYDPSKLIDESTFMLLEFHGQGFREQSNEIVKISPTRVTNYEPLIRIF